MKFVLIVLLFLLAISFVSADSGIRRHRRQQDVEITPEPTPTPHRAGAPVHQLQNPVDVEIATPTHNRPAASLAPLSPESESVLPKLESKMSGDIENPSLSHLQHNAKVQKRQDRMAARRSSVPVLPHLIDSNEEEVSSAPIRKVGPERTERVERLGRRDSLRSSKKTHGGHKAPHQPSPPTLNVESFGASEIQRAFQEFTLKFNRNYIDTDESNYRFNIFAEKYAAVQKHNIKADNGEFTYWMGINQFSDQTEQEYRSLLLASPKGVDVTLAAETFEYDPSAALPSEVDWRKEGVVTGVKDQGGCGSCWTFSAIGSMEGAHALQTKNLISLSEQEIVDCLEDHKGCGGGWMIWAFEYVIKQNGTESEADYPYLGTDGHACKWMKNKTVATFTSYVNVTVGSEDALTAASAARPGVSVAIDASHPSFSGYQKGVYYEPDCKNDVDDLDHAVLVVGYGTLNGTDYYLVKNSWGLNWGMDGYIMMARNKSNNCGIATAASFILP